MASTTNDAEFLAKNAGFVLKLRLVGVGGTPQIRRVKLDRLVVSGRVSHEALVALAIQYTFPDAPLVLEDYEVALTYYDVDNDCCTIGSTEELVDAVDQFSGMSPPVLRLTTDVKRKKNRPAPVTPKRGAAKRGVKSPPKSERQQQHRHRANSPGRQATQQLQTLLESFVGILATAMVALQAHMNPDPPASLGNPRANTVGAGTAASKEEAKESTAKASSPSAEAPTKLDEARRFVKEVVENINMEAEPKEKDTLEERPFIHGRHTCDACLVTPIVGTRYHATNLPDYDLCSACKESYMGKEIKFETAELDRDRPFQDRWHRRRARWAGGGRKCRPHRRCNRKSAVPPVSVDAALKEAIRRSLQDSKARAEAAKKEEPKVEETKPEQEAETEEAEEETAKKTKEEAEPETKTEKEVKSESFSSGAVGNGPAAEALGQTLDQCADAIDAMMTELSREVAHGNNEQEPEPTAPIEETHVDEKQDTEDVSAMTSSVPSILSGPKPEIVADPPIIDAECVNIETAQETEVVENAMILESTETEEEDARSQATEDEWQVVNDDDQIAGDEMLARAFQLIGSALFQSDMNGSAQAAEGDAVNPTASVEMENSSSSSSSSSSDSPDEVSTVPSTVPSIVSSSDVVPLAVQARWAVQLEKLRELGFADEAKCVDVLERLHAANLGSEEDEEVSVTHVVNEMLKNN